MNLYSKNPKNFNNEQFSKEDISSILTTVKDYCIEHKNTLNKGAKKKMENGMFDEFCHKNIVKDNLNKVYYPRPRTTAPDELTSIFLEKIYGHDLCERERVVQTYADQKQAEMTIGKLLELYIQKTGLKFGWCCTGELVKDVDFIKKVHKGWQIFQIKNSDNTENSAASKVRDNTEIFKWSRRNSKKENTYYWDSFPDADLRKQMTEKGFRKYINDYYSAIKPKI